MKPLNQAERKKAFANFLLFFIITVAVIITVVFFSIQVPFKQNDLLRRQVAKVENERIFLDVFKIKMEETVSLLDSAARATNPILIDDRASRNIKEMSGMINDSVPVKNLYENMVQNLADLLAAKQELRKSSDKEAAILEYKSQVAQLNASMADCKRSYDAYRNAPQH